MKINITKPKLKNIYQALQSKKPKSDYDIARTNLSSDALERYVLKKLIEVDAKRKP